MGIGEEAYLIVLTIVLGNNKNGKNDKHKENNSNNNPIEVNVGYTVTYTKMKERGLAPYLLENKNCSPVGAATPTTQDINICI